MLRLEKLSLFQYRNYTQQYFDFRSNIIGIVGKNGIGKTNLLDAIYFLSFTKSYIHKADIFNVQQDKNGMRIEGDYLLNNKKMKGAVIIRENQKKEIVFDQIIYKKLADHIGKIPLVMVIPDDLNLINGSSEERRRWIDIILSQVDKAYLTCLIAYNQILVQRNALLKQKAENPSISIELLDIFNQQLAEKAVDIYEKRKTFLAHFIPLILEQYLSIATESIVIRYNSVIAAKPFLKTLEENLSKDLALQRTTQGTHRDELFIYLDTSLFKMIASQGQKKTLLFALKFAEWAYLKEQKSVSPILLLDDVFEKLDEGRMQMLFQKVGQLANGQIFITDTHRDRLENFLKQSVSDYQLIIIE